MSGKKSPAKNNPAAPADAKLNQGELTNYFGTTTHIDRMNAAIDRESKKVQQQATFDLFWTISDSVGVLMAHCAFFKTVGLKTVAIEILRGALKFTRQG